VAGGDGSHGTSATSAVVVICDKLAFGTVPKCQVVKMADASVSRGDIRSALSNRGGWKSLIAFFVLALAWLAGFSSRLFAVIRFESIIHEFDPW